MTDNLPARTGAAATWRRVLLYFTGWTLIAVIFATVLFAASRSEGNRGFGFVSSLEFNLVLFYWLAFLSLPIFWFTRRFPIEVRPLNTRNLLIHIPAILVLAVGHQVIHLTTLWTLL